MRISHRVAATLSGLLLLPVALSAQAAPGAAGEVGVLVMAHGGLPEWDRAVVDAVRPLKATVPTALALGMADPTTMQAALDSLQAAGAKHVAVVRLFLSGESFLHDTEFYLGLRDDAPEVTMAMMMAQMGGHGGHGGHGSAAAGHGAAHGGGHGGAHGGGHAAGHGGSSPAVHGAAHGSAHDPAHGGGHPAADPPQQLARSAEILLEMRGLSEMPLTADIITDRAKQVSTDPARESVIVIAHGMGDDGENQRVLDNMATSVQALRDAGFTHVRAAALREDWPDKREQAEKEIRDWVGARIDAGDRVIVVPFRVFGFGGYAEVLSGLEHTAADGLLPHPLITEWIADSAGALFCSRQVANPLASCGTAHAH